MNGIRNVSRAAIGAAGVLFAALLASPAWSTNEIVGPPGAGPEHWVPRASLPFRVNFENLPLAASAPVQVLHVTVPLDPAMDLGTFRLGGISFGSHQILVPADRTSYSAQPLFPDLDLYVRLTAALDVSGRTADWTLTAIDPQTGQIPTDPLRGFLPVSDQNGSGAGYVDFTVSPGDVSDGTVASQAASVQFDGNAPMPFPPVTLTIDAHPPTSHLQPGYTLLGTDSLELVADVSDPPGGSGADSVSLWGLVDGGPFTRWLTLAAGEPIRIHLPAPHQYGFFALARDLAGNVEPMKSLPEGAYITGVTGVPADGGGGAWLRLVSSGAGTTCALELRLDAPGRVRAALFDAAGRRVRSLLDGTVRGTGWQREPVSLDGLPPGVYLLSVDAGDRHGAVRAVVRR